MSFLFHYEFHFFVYGDEGEIVIVVMVFMNFAKNKWLMLILKIRKMPANDIAVTAKNNYAIKC